MKLSDITTENINAYIQGKIRYKMYYSKYTWIRNLIPLHIFEQISYRLFVMDKECYNNGSCKLCGCVTPALQMANKACEKPCYPEMMDRIDWETHKYFNKIDFFYTKEGNRDFRLSITRTTKL